MRPEGGPRVGGFSRKLCRYNSLLMPTTPFYPPPPLATRDLPLHLRQLAAPKGNRAKLLAPSADASGVLIAANWSRLDACDCDLNGVSVRRLAVEARRQLIAAALDYTRSYRDVADDCAADRNGCPPVDPGGSSAALPKVVLAGHQPEMFHPGVWLKNFVLGEVARRHGAVAVNLIVDSDTMKTSSIRVPTGDRNRPTVEAVLFDRPAAAMPFEERLILDPEVFAGFGERVANVIAAFVEDPFVKEFWPAAVKRGQITGRPALALAQARHIWEERWGGHTLEVPQSLVCSLPAFHTFSAYLLAHLPRLWEIYNSALAEYRRANRVRSHTHPAPALADDDAWLEAPFWVWTAADPTRRHLFVRQKNDRVVLADRAGWTYELELSPDGELDKAAVQLAELQKAGIRLRTRALITTMVARVLLGDLFLHGIGGAKYDQMTDEVISRFFGIEAPAYMVVSGTLHLPVDYPRDSEAEIQRLRQAQRELTWHPEHYLDHVRERQDLESGLPPINREAVRRAIEDKRRWIATQPVPQNARARFQAIRAANDALQPWLASERQALEAREKSLAQASRTAGILSSREYSFCLYPAEVLREFLVGGGEWSSTE